MTATDELFDLSELEEKIVRRVKSQGLAQGWWEPVHDFLAPGAAMNFATAIEFEDEMLAAGNAISDYPGLSGFRQFIREIMARWHLIDDSRIALVPLDELGRDADLRRLATGKDDHEEEE